MKFTTFVTLGCVLVAAGCDNPIEPSGRQVTVRGTVTNRLGQPLAGALVEALDGSRAGTKTRTDGTGKFQLRAVSALDPQWHGLVEGPVTLRVTHSGFRSRTLEGHWMFDISEPTPPAEWVIWLDNGPTIDLEPGAHTLTFTIDPATARDLLARGPCKGFPAEFASRSFPATIEMRDRALELYDVVLETRPWTTGFSLYRVGSFLEAEVYVLASLTEGMSGFRHLNISGTTSRTTEPPSDTGTSVSLPFHATFQYCQLKSALGMEEECMNAPLENVVVYNSCTSESATMTFTKR